MSDLFHPDVPDSFRLDVWQVMGAAPQHTYQVLTKRPQAMASFCRRLSWSMPPHTNVMTGEPYLEAVDPITVVGWPHGTGWDDYVEDALPNVWLGTSIESDTYVFRADHLRDTPAAVRFLSLEPLLGPLPSLDLTGIDWVIVGGESGPGARPMHKDWVRSIRDQCSEAGVSFFFKQWGGVNKKKAGRSLDGRKYDGMPCRSSSATAPASLFQIAPVQA
jgi:protein gp37